MSYSKVYEITRKQPKFSWRKITIKHLVYEALKELKRADVPKIMDAVLAKGYTSRQKDQHQQIRFYLWQFTKEGIAREKPDRRWRPRPEVLQAVKPSKTHKSKHASQDTVVAKTA